MRQTQSLIRRSHLRKTVDNCTEKQYNKFVLSNHTACIVQNPAENGRIISQESLHMNDNQNVQRELTEEEKKNPVSSGAVEWHDPLDKPAQQKSPTGKLAIASVLLGLAGICTSCAAPAAFILGIAGIICGVLSGSKNEDSDKLRKIGILLSAGAICTGIIVLIIRVIVNSGSEKLTEYYHGIEGSTGI